MLHEYAIVDGFVTVPIHTYMEFVYEDDLGKGACNYPFAVSNIRSPLDSSYDDVLYTRDELSSPFSIEFGKS